MAKVLDMPKLSPTMEEGVLSAWHKKEGDEIAVDDLLAEVETDKATMEFRSFDKGTLLKILVSAGAQVKLGQPVAIVGSAGEDVSAMAAQHAAQGAPAPQDRQAPATGVSQGAAPPPVTPPAPRPAPAAESSAATAAVHSPSPERARVASVLDRTSYPGEAAAAAVHGNGKAVPAGGRVLASPYVRKVARERGIDLQGAHGTGPGGRIVPADLASLATRPAAPLTTGSNGPGAGAGAIVPAAAAEEPEIRPLSQMRKAIARRLTESKSTVPHFYLSIDVDATGLVALRERINAELSADSNGKANGDGAHAAGVTKVSLNDLLIKACASALVRVPECNASFSPEALVLHKRVDISVAVAIPDGLVTPVVRNADRKTVVAIAREVRELASRARARKLKPEEMQGGTFSVSNLGMFGIDEFAAVINPPEGAILAVGQVRDVPVVSDGAVVAGKRLAMTLSCDHRVVDGAVGAAFLAELRRLVEHPLRVLTG